MGETTAEFPWGRTNAPCGEPLAIRRHRFELRLRTPVKLPPFPGSALRGLFGHGLRRTACVTQAPRCEGCPLLSTCVYVSLFETRSSDERLSRSPPPFVFTLEAQGVRHLKPGQAFSFGMTLLGPAIPQFPYVVAAWRRAGRVGFGRHGGEFDLERVQQEVVLGSEEWATVYSADSRQIEPTPVRPAVLPPPSDEVLIGLDTPLRLKRDGHLVGPSELRPTHLLRALMWRLSDLQALYAIGGPDIQGDPADWGDPDSALVSSELQWRDWTRYSSRQKTHMQMGGVVGELRLAGRALAPWWPLLWLGQWIHAGKQTSMGLGAYRLRSPASL